MPEHGGEPANSKLWRKCEGLWNPMQHAWVAEQVKCLLGDDEFQSLLEQTESMIQTPYSTARRLGQVKQPRRTTSVYCRWDARPLLLSVGSYLLQLSYSLYRLFTFYRCHFLQPSKKS
ncbi:uncharacterized protein TrAtP1_002728 [Trichoderma atroviride]|uniref:uncharacterized protein n=1 Tax=Hypocrea atroviridis TaxID=63577 RepID=UPI00332B4D00|nr:hypothetical protein TrAtP1_002728 [Trichoderma atroviride]